MPLGRGARPHENGRGRHAWLQFCGPLFSEQANPLPPSRGAEEAAHGRTTREKRANKPNLRRVSMEPDRLPKVGRARKDARTKPIGFWLGWAARVRSCRETFPRERSQFRPPVDRFNLRPSPVLHRSWDDGRASSGANEANRAERRLARIAAIARPSGSGRCRANEPKCWGASGPRVRSQARRIPRKRSQFPDGRPGAWGGMTAEPFPREQSQIRGERPGRDRGTQERARVRDDGREAVRRFRRGTPIRSDSVSGRGWFADPHCHYPPFICAHRCNLWMSSFPSSSFSLSESASLGEILQMLLSPAIPPPCRRLPLAAGRPPLHNRAFRSKSADSPRRSPA
jgi:hypothetical protein